MKRQIEAVGGKIKENLRMSGKVGREVTIIFLIILMKIIVSLHIKKILKIVINQKVGLLVIHPKRIQFHQIHLHLPIQINLIYIILIQLMKL